MRRFSFYILIALLTFGIGSFIAFKLYWENNEQHSALQNKTKSSDDKIEFNSQQKNSEKEIKYICRDEIINQLEKYLNTQEFVQHVNNSQMIRDDFQNNTIDCSEIYKLRKVDLNRDGESEIIVTGNTYGLCTVRGNCELWGFRKTDNGYEQILRNEWTFKYKILQTYTKGFADIEVDINSSNGNPSNYLNIHKFNGKLYEMKDCFDGYEFDGDKKLTKPKKIRDNCENFNS